MLTQYLAWRVVHSSQVAGYQVEWGSSQSVSECLFDKLLPRIVESSTYIDISQPYSATHTLYVLNITMHMYMCNSACNKPTSGSYAYRTSPSSSLLGREITVNVRVFLLKSSTFPSCSTHRYPLPSNDMAAAELNVSLGPCHVFWIANSFLEGQINTTFYMYVYYICYNY